MAVLPERSVRVSTLELSFDPVFVFTVTQLTGVLVDEAPPPLAVERQPRCGRPQLELTASGGVAIVRDLMILARS